MGGWYGAEQHQGSGDSLRRRYLGGMRALTRHFAILGFAAVGLLLSCPAVFAQTPPNAGTILRDYAPSNQPPPPPTLPPPLAAPPELAPPSGGGKVLVHDFHIVATKFPEAVLKGLIKDYMGRELTLGELKEAALKISEFYRAHDLLARAYIPQQNIENGVVEIIVLEGKLGAVIVDPSSVTRLDHSLAVGMVESRAPVGEDLHPNSIDEAVAILNDVPGVRASATLVPGAKSGETIADLKLADSPLVSGSLQTDNGGSRFSGEHRLIGSSALNDPFGLGEQESVTVLKTNGTTYGKLAAQMPVGTSGLAIGVDGSGLQYHLGNIFKPLDEGGYAATGGFFATYPILRTPSFGLTALSTFDYKKLVDWALETVTDNKSIEVGSLRLAGIVKDSWFGGAISNFNVGVTAGNLDRSADAADLAGDQATARTNGTYSKLVLGASRLQTLIWDTDLYFNAYGQFAFKNLESTEQMSLGGPDGVRAYPINEASGDSGAVGTVELRHHLPYGLVVSGFYDVGGIEQHTKTWSGWQTVVGQPNLYYLQGIGVSSSWTPESVPGLQAKVTYAHALGENPGRNASGNNADGKHAKNELWFQVNYLF
jgi:hemolysin activation/secretion protein